MHGFGKDPHHGRRCLQEHHHRQPRRGKYLAWHLASSGEKTVVGRRWIGGSCPSINCFPSKNEIWSAKVADLVHHADHFGSVPGSASVDMAAVRRRKRAMVDGLIAMHVEKYKASGAELPFRNGNTYEEGLGDAWAPIRQYWSDPTTANREILRGLFTPDDIRRKYHTGMSETQRIAPESYTLDAALMARPGNVDIQLDDDPNATVQFLDTGHFALETHLEEITFAMHDFLASTSAPPAPLPPESALRRSITETVRVVLYTHQKLSFSLRRLGSFGVDFLSVSRLGRKNMVTRAFQPPIRKSLTLNLTWFLTALLFAVTVENVWIDPWIRLHFPDFPSLAPEPPSSFWIAAFAAIGIICVLLLVGLVLLVRRPGVSLASKIIAGATVATAVALSVLWFLVTSGLSRAPRF